MKETTNIDATNSNEAYLDKIQEITQFFSLYKDFGLFFCTCSNFALRKEVNNTVRHRLLDKNILVVEYLLEDEEHFKPIPYQIQELIDDNPEIKGVIINNLDFLISKYPDALHLFNQSRDVLTKVEIPLLFWIEKSDISNLATHAQDIFSFRSLSVLEFDDIEFYGSEERLAQRFSEEFRSKEDYEKIRLRIEILERQLKEAEDSNYPVKNLVNNIVIPLFNAYQNNQIFDKSIKLFKKYEQNFDNENVLHLEMKLQYFSNVNNIDEVKNVANQIINLQKNSENHLGLAFSLEKISTTFNNLNLSDATLNYQLEAINIFLQYYDENDPILAHSYNNLGFIYSKKEQVNLAEKYFIKSIEINEKKANIQPTNLAAIYGNLATIYTKNGNLKLALKHSELALELEKKTLDPDHPSIAISLHNLANIYLAMEDTDNAEKYIKESIKIQEKTLSSNDQLIGRSYNDHAIILLQKGKSKEAELILRNFITRQQSYLGEQNPQLAFSYLNFAYILWESKKAKEALSYANLSIKILRANSMEKTKEYKNALFVLQKIESKSPYVKPTKQSRNEKCACGSGKKYKHCHGA